MKVLGMNISETILPRFDSKVCIQMSSEPRLRLKTIYIFLFVLLKSGNSKFCIYSAGHAEEGCILALYGVGGLV
jgi:hypothetical protein